MFMHLLNVQQKRALITLAGTMVTSDGTAEGEELDYLKQLMIESGLGRDLGEVRSDDAVDLAVFDSHGAKCAALAELLILSVLDGHYDINEAAFADGLVDKLGLSGADHEALCAVAGDAAGALAKMRSLVR